MTNPANKLYGIRYCYGLRAPDEESAREMIESAVKLPLGGDTKYAAEVWRRIHFMFEVFLEDDPEEDKQEWLLSHLEADEQ